MPAVSLSTMAPLPGTQNLVSFPLAKSIVIVQLYTTYNGVGPSLALISSAFVLNIAGLPGLVFNTFLCLVTIRNRCHIVSAQKSLCPQFFARHLQPIASIYGTVCTASSVGTFILHGGRHHWHQLHSLSAERLSPAALNLWRCSCADGHASDSCGPALCRFHSNTVFPN